MFKFDFFNENEKISETITTELQQLETEKGRELNIKETKQNNLKDIEYDELSITDTIKLNKRKLIKNLEYDLIPNVYEGGIIIIILYIIKVLKLGSVRLI